MNLSIDLYFPSISMLKMPIKIHYYFFQTNKERFMATITPKKLAYDIHRYCFIYVLYIVFLKVFL